MADGKVNAYIGWMKFNITLEEAELKKMVIERLEDIISLDISPDDLRVEVCPKDSIAWEPGSCRIFLHGGECE